MTELKAGVEMDGTYKGFRYQVVLQNVGHRCGYVLIPDNHPLFELGYDDPIEGISAALLDGEKIGKRGPIPLLVRGLSEDDAVTMDVLFDVHGSVTYANYRHAGEKADEAESWWIGFDCAHSGDAPEPEMIGSPELASWYETGIVRTRDYVLEECKSLIDQIHRHFPRGKVAKND